jgi:hypothetical protein
MASSLFAAAVSALLAAIPVGPIGGGNATTFPAQRHLVRVAPAGASPVWMLAVQQDTADHQGLSFFRSDDEAASFTFYAPIQPDPAERSTADLAVVGSDIALVYSYEGPRLAGSSTHDVYFQWWRYQAGDHGFAPRAPVRVFDATSSTQAYYRAELAVDSLGRIWVQAFRLEADGSGTAVISVSTDGGATFQEQPSLDQVPGRGGGRLLSLGSRLLFLYSSHNGFMPTRMRVREDSAPLAEWGAVANAFPEGIYHGAALSAVASGGGGMHLVYKSEDDEALYYRYFDGAAFGSRVLVEGPADWAVQPALTQVGDVLALFTNHLDTATGSYALHLRNLRGGTWGPVQVLQPLGGFKGYPASAAELPVTVPRVPCIYGQTPNASEGGTLMLVSVAPDGSAPPPPPENVLPLVISPEADSYAEAANPNARHGTDARVLVDRNPLSEGYNSGAFRQMTGLSDGILLAEVSVSGQRYLARSSDAGITCRSVLSLGQYRSLTPHSWAELGSEVFFLEYQSFTSGDAPIRLWVSGDRGRTWTVRTTFSGHRHGHGLLPDPTRGALWAFFGDTTRQAGTYRSTDGGRSFSLVLPGQEGCIVDATLLSDGSILFGQDIGSLPNLPHVARLSPVGDYQELFRLSGPAYSIFALSGGGYVIGAAREPNGDIYPPGEVSARLYASPNGLSWAEALAFPRLSESENARADVYFALPSGELVLQLENVQGMGPGGKGFQLLRVNRDGIEQPAHAGGPR